MALGLASCAKAPAPGLAAFQALKRIELRTNRLVWHEEYASDLAQAKSVLDAYLSGGQGHVDPALRTCLETALFDYDMAGQLWDILRQAGQNGSGQKISRVCIKRTSATGGLLAAYLRSIDALPPIGGDGCAMDEIEITSQVRFLWEHAAGQLRRAAQLMGLKP